MLPPESIQTGGSHARVKDREGGGGRGRGGRGGSFCTSPSGPFPSSVLPQLSWLSPSPATGAQATTHHGYQRGALDKHMAPKAGECLTHRMLPAGGAPCQQPCPSSPSPPRLLLPLSAQTALFPLLLSSKEEEEESRRLSLSLVLSVPPSPPTKLIAPAWVDRMLVLETLCGDLMWAQLGREKERGRGRERERARKRASESVRERI